MNDSLSWTEEGARYLLILLAFVGIIKCQVLDSHIRLEFVDGWFRSWIGTLKLIALALTLFFSIFLIYSLYILGSSTHFLRMVSLPFPKYYLYIVVGVALGCLVLVQVYQLFKLLAGRDR